MEFLSHSVLDFEALRFSWVSWESLEIAVLLHLCLKVSLVVFSCAVPSVIDCTAR